MDYKKTLNLPKTGFAMKADLVVREPRRLERWESERIYQRVQEERAGAPKFVLHDGPPFANGEVHIGTGLNKILKDIVIRYQSLRGKSAPYIPGWDCHGLPIEFKVTQEMRKTSGDAASSPAAVRTACEAYARKFIELQRSQFKRLGVTGDWDNPYLTFNKEYEADELRLFADLVERGFVYRGKKPVYWSIPCQTALAEFEVEYRDHISQSVYVKFPIQGEPNMFVLIWTTTPWTLPANLAVAYNAGFNYTMVRVGEEVYLLSVALLDEVSKKCGWDNYEIIRSVYGEQLAGLEYRHPFINRTGRFFAADFVENSAGTGFVHIAPGHGLDDYLLGRDKGLPIYSPVDDAGRFVHTHDLPADQQMPAPLLGKGILEKQGRSEANEAVIEVLCEQNALLSQEDYPHSYPFCWRSKTPVIFRAMDQWFIRIDHDDFRKKSLEAINQIRWVPDWGKNRMEASVKSRPDWCISRQRTWGVPIPAFYDEKGEPILEAGIVRRAADLIEKQGSNFWFERSASELWAEVKPEHWTGPDPAAKSSDTLDVWIDSGSSSRSVLMRRAELTHAEGESARPAWQADIYLEGSDQHRGWFQSSLLLSLAGNGTAPYRTVVTHGFMVDADREKISKSKQGQGGYEKPQTAEAYVKKYGADVVRLWVASQDFRNDIIVSDERISKVSESYRGIRNTLRYQLSNLYDFDPEKDTVAEEDLTGLDRWILEAFRELERQVAAAYEEFEYHLVYQRISQFAAVELSAIYHDVVKDRLYTDPARSLRRRSTQTTLYRLVQGLCQMLAPVLAFTADEAWEFIPGKKKDSVHLTTWNPNQAPVQPGSWKLLLDLREQLLPHLETARQAKLIGKALDAKLTLRGDGQSELIQVAHEHQEDLRELLNVSQLELRVQSGQDKGNAVLDVKVTHAEGKKCDRCWHWETDVGADPEHPAICGRCLSAVRERA